MITNSLGKWDKTYTPKTKLAFISQRTNEYKVFITNEIKVQIEGERGEFVSIRGKYPNDDWFATTNFDMLIEV